MKGKFFYAGLIAALVLSTNNVFSAVISYTYTGSGSGNLGGNEFFNEDFTIFATGNTDNREKLEQGFSIQNTTATINISDVGNLTFLIPTRFFVNHEVNAIGFSRDSGSMTDLFDTIDSAFGSWNMLESIGTINGTGGLLQWSDFGPAVMTSGGILNFNDEADINVTFHAEISPIPEPTTWAMLLAGLGLLGFMGRRRVIG